jgi:Zn-dependent protease with chaperone function
MALAEKVEALVARVGYRPLHGMVLVSGVDGAAAATQQQQQQQQQQHTAYCSGGFGGFGGSPRRIVLPGSLLARATDEEVCALVARALGCWRMSHAAQAFVAAQLHAAAMFAAFDALVARRGPLASGGCMFASFGFASRPTMVGLLLFLTAVWVPLGKALSLARVAHARRNAFGADAFAARLGYSAALQRALVKVHAEALCGGGDDGGVVGGGGGGREEDYLNLAPDGWYSSYRFSRPTLVERVGAIGAGATGGRAPAEKEGGAGEEGEPKEEAKEKEDGGAKKKRKNKKKKEKQGGSTGVESRDRAQDEGEDSKAAKEADDTKLKRA